MARSTTLATLGVVALLIAAAPAVTTTPGDDAPATAPDALPDGVRLLDAQLDGPVELPPTQRLRDLLLDAVDPRDPTTLLDAAQQHVADAWGASEVLLVDADEEEPGEDAPEPGEDAPDEVLPDLHGTFVTGRAASDVDGDGLHDALVTTTDIATGATDLRALRGLDGLELWRVPITPEHSMIGWPAGDLTGDGIADLFALGLRFVDSDESEDCDDDGCTGWYEATYTWVLAARSGNDGSVLWQQEHPGTYRWEYVEQYTADGSEYSYTLDAEDLVTLPWPGGDHDGDGGRDVIVNTIDLHDAYTETTSNGTLGPHREGSYELDSTTSARILRGADGDSMLAALTSQGPSIALLEDAGDATGDGLTDLLWQRVEYGNDTWSCDRVVVIELCEDEESDDPPVLHLELLDGADLTTTWTFAAEIDPWTGYALPLGDDLDGTPGDDVVVIATGEPATLDPEEPLPGSRPGDDVTLLSGTDGTTTWTVDHPDGWPFTAAEMGGTTGPDLLFSAWVLQYSGCGSPLVPDPTCEETTTATQIARRLDGQTGELFSDTTRTYDLGSAPDYFWFAFSWFSGDHDGDGVSDPRMNVGTDNRSVAVVQSAVTGAVLYEHVGEEELLLTYGGGDLDGTGTDELGTWVWGDDVIEVLTMPDGEVLHRLDRFGDPLYGGGDQDGVAGDELLRVRHTLDETGHVRAVVESLHGATLSPRWSLELTAG